MNQVFVYVILGLFVGYRTYRFILFRRTRRSIPDMLQKGALIIDVRTDSEFRAGHNPVSINIPLSNLEKELSKYEKSKAIIFCCASGARSESATKLFLKNGFISVTNAGPWQNTLQK